MISELSLRATERALCSGSLDHIVYGLMALFLSPCLQSLDVGIPRIPPVSQALYMASHFSCALCPLPAFLEGLSSLSAHAGTQLLRKEYVVTLS